MTDFAQLNLGMLDRSRSNWHKVKGFPRQHGARGRSDVRQRRTAATDSCGGDGVADHRGITMVIHYSLMKTPDFGYRPRIADDRVGHFLSATKDFGVTDADSNFVRMINRWRLEKANPAAKLSPPRKQIVWYVEDTVPIEYRPYVEEGIREWNKAFEKIGFKDAIAVRWEEAGRDDFDPEDTNYCTFRWVTNDMGGAMSCLRANPLTGEMIDGDVVFDAGFIRYWKQAVRPPGRPHGLPSAAQPQTAPLAIGEVISPILASKMGYGLPQSNVLLGIECTRQEPGRMVPEAASRPTRSPLAWERRQELRPRHSRLLPVPDRLPARLRPGRDCAGRRSEAPTSPPPTSKDGQGRQQEARAQGRAARGVHRPGDQAHRDARGRPLARPAAQLQGQHDAARPTSSTTRRSRGSRDWSAA